MRTRSYVVMAGSPKAPKNEKEPFMRLVRLRAPGGLENLKLVEEDPPKPRPDELLIRIRACSLNFHDDMVALGKIPCTDGRIPMSDGAGEVIAVGTMSMSSTSGIRSSARFTPIGWEAK